MKTTSFLFAVTASIACAQGPLNPLATPAPSMKTLDQIEARTPIPPSFGVPIPGPHFTIMASGSYYLTGNITVSTGNAIVISAGGSYDYPARGVTLDLNGFTITSTLTGSSNGNAINAPITLAQLSVRNGNIVSGTTVSDAGVVTAAGFENGIVQGGSSSCLVTRVNVSGVSTNGIDLNSQGTVSECTAENCGDGGLRANTVINSSSVSCKNMGIFANNATNCSGTSITGAGISCAGPYNIYNDSLMGGNATNCTGTSSSGSGLVCGSATNCTGISNSGIGLFCRGSTGSGSILYGGNAMNSTGTSISGDGLMCDGNATNCSGITYSVSNKAIAVKSTANSCRGTNTAGGTALSAAIAIGCTTGGGAVISPQKYLGTS